MGNIKLKPIDFLFFGILVFMGVGSAIMAAEYNIDLPGWVFVTPIFVLAVIYGRIIRNRK